ncbi:MAG: hypothetical protein DM484_08065 [Candidatus Methylumidiphilus alinenensis]|uniref:Uncharacterized protein n=1 Tax=Candidatus Methylumidiphilus alinenensis TaxID=2202197 RepID=A0A2W4RFS5_9GAMM|nr:MAG: hypothetical protein DM484_08065 [Candidatus Methylumidiphilus alinenensis]
MVGFRIFWFCSKSLADAAVSRSRAFPALVQKTAGIHAEAALPARKGVKSFFWRSWGTVRLVPRRHRPPPRGDPQKGRPLARTA